MGVKDKLTMVKKICADRNISMDEVAYVGDDINDLELLRAVGFSASVPNAIQTVRDAVDYVTERSGGSGAVREVIDYILH